MGLQELKQPITIDELLKIIGMLFVQSQKQTERIQQLENEQTNTGNSKTN